jgi:hypothetical protein
VLLGPACWCLITAQPLSPAISRTLPLTPGPPSRSSPRVSHPHRVARARPLPLLCSRDNATARARRPGALLIAPRCRPLRQGPHLPSSFSTRPRPQGPPPFFPTLPRATEPLEKLLAAALSPFFHPISLSSTPEHLLPPPPSPRPCGAAQALGAAALP